MNLGFRRSWVQGLGPNGLHGHKADPPHPSCAKAKISVSCSVSLKVKLIRQAMLITQNTTTAQDMHTRSTNSWLLLRVSQAALPIKVIKIEPLHMETTSLSF